MFNIILPKINLRIEKWKWNKEYQIYVSNMGHFKNKQRQNVPIKVTGTGYCGVYTTCGLKTAHRIVMLTWKPIPDAERLTIDHLDHNKRNNSIYNLEWVTREENLDRSKKDLYITEFDREISKLKDEISLLKKELNTKEKRKIIVAGNKQFNSLDAAAAWVIKKQKIKNNVNIDSIKERINKAITRKIKYCGCNWKII